MKISNIKLNNNSMLKGAILIDAKEVYGYVDGVKSKAPLGTNFEVVLPNAGYEKVNIKIDGLFVEQNNILFYAGSEITFKEVELTLLQNYSTKEISIRGKANEFFQTKK